MMSQVCTYVSSKGKKENFEASALKLNPFLTAVLKMDTTFFEFISANLFPNLISVCWHAANNSKSLIRNSNCYDRIS
uniref:Ovule protein n=1 Tax=Acrobeloides nanus TaxID=290746 RepID=A0A914DLE2_9BILA